MIQVGQRLPSATLYMMSATGPAPISTEDVFGGKRVLVFGVPGAFTPTCSDEHLPGFVEQAAAIRARGIDTIACLVVNDPFVLQAWAKATGADAILMLSDGNLDLTPKLGLEMDASRAGLGTRCQRFSLVADDGVVSVLNVEKPGRLDVSTAAATLCQL